LNKSSLIHRQLCVFLGHATFSVKKSCSYFLSAPLKTIISEAIKNVLEERENRFMKSILDESFFRLESLIIVPTDRDLAIRLEDFFGEHERYESDFKRIFFKQLMQSEYRSSRGGTVRVDSDFLPAIQLDQSSLESITDDEKFQITLKGRQIRFKANATLDGPIKRSATKIEPPIPDQSPSYGQESPLFGQNTHRESSPQPKLQVKLLDSNGVSYHSLTIPALIGRDPVSMAEKFNCSFLKVESTYVSRLQIYVFEMLGEVCYVIPGQSSLVCMTSDGFTRLKKTIYPLDTRGSEVLNLGVSLDYQSTSPPQGPSSDYAIIELSVLSNPGDTPKPRGVN
jgi:hypothetical protein